MQNGLSEGPSALVLVLDLSVVLWHRLPFSVTDVLSVIKNFFSMFMSFSQQNFCSLIVTTSHDSYFIYKSPAHFCSHTVEISNLERSCHTIASLDHSPNDPSTSLRALTSGLSKAMCYINRHSTKSSDTLYGSIICVSPLSSTHFSTSVQSFTPLLNVAFAAKKRQIPIDFLVFDTSDEVSHPLHQLSYISGGCFQCFNVSSDFSKTEFMSRILQVFTINFLTPLNTRTSLPCLSNLNSVDTRAFCSCHGNLVSIGFVCSSCCSVSCRPARFCPGCKDRLVVVRSRS
ncbi:hypothetical protein GEMRC1_003990 [Eukaryota sp. GEM-RC1]